MNEELAKSYAVALTTYIEENPSFCDSDEMTNLERAAGVAGEMGATGQQGQV